MKGTVVAIRGNDRDPGRVAAFEAVPMPVVGRGRALPLLAAAAILLIAAAGHVRAATYKWVDERGVTHYSDKMPAEAVNRGSAVLDKQAVTIKKVDPALTPEQVRARQAEAERAQALAREQQVIARRDRALLSSYTNEAEIDLARARVLVTLESQLQAAQAYSETLSARKETLTARKNEAGAKGLSQGEERELDGIGTELAKQQALIELKQRERVTANQKYDADKARWRELRAQSDANAEAATGAGPRPASAPSASAVGSTTARSK